MKAFTPAILLATSATAAPSVISVRQTNCNQNAQPSADQVANAIRDWLTDVQTVNNFVGTGLSNPGNLTVAAQNALSFAQNEPNDLNVLAGLCGVTTEYTDAVNNLKTVFGGVLGNLQDIIDGTADPAAAIHNINQIRCCNVLPDLDVLWLEAAEDSGIVGQVQTTVPRPNACASITCELSKVR